MRSLVLLLLLSLTACSASANLDVPDPATPPEPTDMARVHTQLRAVDGTLAGLRARLEGAEVDHDVVAQALRVHEQSVASLQSRVWALDGRLDEAQDSADVALAVALEASEADDALQSRLVAVEEQASDALSRLGALQSATVGLRSVDIDGAVCGLTAVGSGAIYRIATGIRPDHLLLLAGEDGALRVQIAAPVVCGVTPVDDFAQPPHSVTEGAAVYVLEDSGGWFHVGA
jgi:hypothetical protein